MLKQRFASPSIAVIGLYAGAAGKAIQLNNDNWQTQIKLDHLMKRLQAE